MARMSNRDRIQRAAEEARAADAEKTAKKAAKKTAKKATKRTPRARAKEVRMKIVWSIFNASGKAIETFAYPDKEAATARARKLSESTGRPHEVRGVKVPME